MTNKMTFSQGKMGILPTRIGYLLPLLQIHIPKFPRRNVVQAKFVRQKVRHLIGKGAIL
jgi:hypothetical protein